MSHRPLPLVACIAIVAAGCSAGRYEADYAKALENYRSDAPFAVLQAAPVELAAGRLKVRLPQGFVAVVPGEEDFHPSRLRPSFLDALPGYEGTFERRLTAEAAEMPVSLAVWSLPAGDGPRTVFEKAFLDKARGDEAFAKTGAAWADRQVVPRTGGPVAWRVLSLTGPQMFESVVAGNQELKRWDSTCEVWLAADPASDFRTLLVWRSPTQVAGQLPMPLPELAETVARTVENRPPPAGDEAAAAPVRAAPAGSAPAAGF